MSDIAQRILFEDNHILIVNKLPSEIVQGDKTGDVSLLDDVKSYIKVKYNKPGEVFAGFGNTEKFAFAECSSTPTQSSKVKTIWIVASLAHPF